MASTLLFTLAVIAVVIALIVVSIFTAMGAVNLTKSATYNSDQHAKNAHRSLTIAAALGWVLVVVLIVVLIMGFFAGGFTTTEISDAILQKPVPTTSEAAAAAKGAKELESGSGAQTIVLVLLIFTSIATLVVGGLAVHAAIQINDIATRDAPANAAYIHSIIAAVVGLGTVGILIVALISWVAIREARAEKIKQLEDFEKKAPAPVPIAAAASPPVISVKPVAAAAVAPTPTSVPHINVKPAA